MLIFSKIFKSIFSTERNAAEEISSKESESENNLVFADELITQAEIMKGIAAIYSSMDKLSAEELEIRKIYLN